MSQSPPLSLEGAYNVRDLGGYPAAGGRRVAKGRIFRAASLSELTEAGQAALKGLGLRLICDLRSTPERAVSPSRLPGDSGFDVWWRDHETSSANLGAALLEPGADPEAIRQLMLGLYRSLPYEQAPSLAFVIRAIAEGATPLLFHCAAGKDRTGFVAAVLLDLLGAPRETIIGDYLVTQRFFEQGMAMLRAGAWSNTLGALGDELLAPLMSAERAYIDAMFGELESRHGSINAFVMDVAGVDAKTVSSLRRALLAD